MKEINIEKSREIGGGGRVYVCPFCPWIEGSYGYVCNHIWKEKCFKKNFWLRSLYYGGMLGWSLGSVLNNLSGIGQGPKPKHMR